MASFLEEGLSIHIATRSGDLDPNGARVPAVKVEEDGNHLVAFVPAAASAAILRDIDDNGQVALVFTRPIDERGCQVKGIATGTRDASDDERELIVAQWERFRDTLESVGLPRIATDAWIVWPSVAVRVRVTATFDQTPGPGAGRPLS